MYDQKTRDFEFRPGPLFANVVLVDEINRAMPKTQSALLEAMAERQITVDGTTYPLPSPFLVLATENPIEFEGVFPLPEAQLDRFFLKARLGYPSADEELLVIRDQRDGHPLERLQPTLGVDDLQRLQAAVGDVYVDGLIERWLVELVRATRDSCSRSRSARRFAAAWRWSGRHGPGRSSTAAATSCPRTCSPCSRPSSDTGSCSRRRSSQSRAAHRGTSCSTAVRPLPRAGAGARAGAGVRAVSAELTFPLVPALAARRLPLRRPARLAARAGSSVAGSRPYRRGDSLASIDWKSSARLSSVAGRARVRRARALRRRGASRRHGRRPAALDEPLPAAVAEQAGRAAGLWKLVSSTAVGELGLVGYLDAGAVAPADDRRGARRGRPQLAETPFTAPDAALADAFAHLTGVRRSLPPGTFVFVCSDFLAPPEPAWWARALAYRWDVVPVILQDPVWEQSFPAVDGLVIPYVDPAGGRKHGVRLRRGEADARRRDNEARLGLQVAELRALGLEPIVLDRSDEPAVLDALSAWGETRLAVRRGEW